LKAGDFIVAVDGEKLTASAPEHDEELAALIRQYDVGAKVELTVWRGPERLKVPVELVRSPKLKREMRKYRNDEFEFTARRGLLRQGRGTIARRRLGSVDRGGQVRRLGRTGHPPGRRPHYHVDARPIRDVDSLKAAMEAIQSRKPKFVVMQVLRGIHTKFLEFEPDWKN